VDSAPSGPALPLTTSDGRACSGRYCGGGFAVGEIIGALIPRSIARAICWLGSLAMGALKILESRGGSTYDQS
jgi:hypothetical protein